MQTLITARTFGDRLQVAGVVLNSPNRTGDDPSVASNADELERRCERPLLATVEHGGGFEQAADWWTLCAAFESSD
jgi:hypothetical protein